ncbi:MAG: carbohydrate ABC transporter permease [Bacilli bacterium]|nr:carbohydrate ABC transporter permease [Bacilli bacterium]
MMNNENKVIKKTFKEKYSEAAANWKNPSVARARNQKILMFFAVLLRILLLAGLCFIILLPLIQKFSFAFRAPEDISNPRVMWIPENFSIINIRLSWELLSYVDSFFGSLLLSSVSTFIQIIATAVAGYSFARLKFFGNNIIFFIVLFTLVVPNETLNIARRLYFSNNGFFGVMLIGKWFAMYVMAAFGMGIRSAIFIYLFRQFFRGVPIELEESAQIDGAGVIRTFWSVMLPNARGAIVTVGLFAFVWQWNDYYFAQVFRYTGVLGTKLFGLSENTTAVIGGNMAYWNRLGIDVDVIRSSQFLGLLSNTMALLMMLPLLIAYFFVQKLFVESIERTGIVG